MSTHYGDIIVSTFSDTVTVEIAGDTFSIPQHSLVNINSTEQGIKLTGNFSVFQNCIDKEIKI